MHLKRLAMPKKWPIPRKGTKYIVKPNASLKESIPTLVVIRDMLSIVRNRKEAKRIILAGKITVNGKQIRDEKYPLGLFDVLKIADINKNYKISIKHKGKFDAKEISNNEADTKVTKIVNKSSFKGNKMQINLSDGRNYLSDLKCKVGDSAVMNFAKNNIEKIIPMEENREAIVLTGKNAGNIGKIFKVDDEKSKLIISMKNGNVEVPKTSVVVIK